MFLRIIYIKNTHQSGRVLKKRKRRKMKILLFEAISKPMRIYIYIYISFKRSEKYQIYHVAVVLCSCSYSGAECQLV